ncbi:SURF1 family protein [Antribacter gilvus]|uniref:SURF1 family protein n=1 Tax=Antribacter gilvus TaxID=2304675 RepID=UPI000F78A825|nr:SURF1 family protein [Antribacter gilvus]
MPAPVATDASVTPPPEAGDRRRTFWEVARQPRMVGILLLLLLAAAVCGRLGVWQLDRAYERAELADRQAAAEAVAEGPAWLGDVLAPQESFPGDLVSRQVQVAGEYEADGQRLVAGRVLDGREGYLVLTPLRVADDGTGGDSWAGLSGAPVVAVVRGWVASPDDASEAPGGEVHVTGWLQAGEAVSGGGLELPDGQVDRVALGALVQEWGGPVYTGYVVLSDATPSPAEDGPALLPRPTLDGGSGVNLQNAFYALQWWVFGAFAVALWVRMVRDDMAGGRRGGDAADPGTGIAGLPG